MKAVLKNFAIFTWEHFVLESFFSKAVGLQVYNFIKKVFSCVYREISQFTNFEEHLRTAASIYSNDLLKYKSSLS